jgi:biopolymer transport protein ExbD
MLRSRNKVSVSFSMSGMTDIVFLLLIFFMLTSTLIAPNALKLLLPQAGQSSSTESKVPEVLLRGDGRIQFNGRNIIIEQLEAVLTAAISGEDEPAMRLITSQGVSVKETVSVMNIAAKLNVQVVLTKDN